MKSVLILFISVFPIYSFANTDSSAVKIKRDSIITYAQTFLGAPYLWGGTTHKGFDCSGFVYHVFSHFGIRVSRTSRGFGQKGDEIDLSEAQAGDIILFTGTNPTIRQIGHVGIVLKNSDSNLDFIHSSSSKKHFGVTVSRFNESGYVKRFLKVINILS